MSYLLDTNAWIDYLKNPSSRIRSKLQSMSSSDIATCSIVRAELLHGAQKYGNRDRRVRLVETTLAPFVSYEFEDADADVYAAIRDSLERSGLIIGPYDLQIAAIAVRRQLTIATSNIGEFTRVADLTIEGWSSP